MRTSPLVLLSLLAGCSVTAVFSDPPDDDVVPDTEPTDSATGSTDSGPTDPTDPTDTDTWDTDYPDPEDYDCSAVPDPPYDFRNLPALANEDLTMDHQGYLVGASGEHVWRASYDGVVDIFVPGLALGAGMRVLPSGQIVAGDYNQGRVVLIEEDGGWDTLATGIPWPNGIEIGPGGLVYTTEYGSSRIFEIDPTTGDKRIISAGTIGTPNGLVFNRDYTELYVASNADGNIYTMRRTEDGEFEPPEILLANQSTTIDGMAIDWCDNLYILNWSNGRVMRTGPDRGPPEVILTAQQVHEGAGNPNYSLSNGVWGSGIGGWNPYHIYIVKYGADRVVEVDIGVPGKPPPPM